MVLSIPGLRIPFSFVVRPPNSQQESMNSATAAIAALIQVSVQRSLLAAGAFATVCISVELSTGDVAAGATVASAIFGDSAVVVPSDDSPALAMRNRIVIGLASA